MNGSPITDISRISRELLLELVENIPIAALVIAGEHLYCNHAAELLTGYSRNEVATFPQWLEKVFGPEHRNMRKRFEREKAAGFPLPREVHITCRDGTRRTVEFAATGKEHVFCILHDLTDRLQAAQTIRDNETLLREAQRIGNLGIYEYDLAHDRWTSSREMDRIFGIDDAYPKTFASWQDLVHPDCRDDMSRYFSSSLAEHRWFDMEYRIVRPCDGVERWVYGTGEFTHDAGGRPVRMIGTIQDITDRKETERRLHVSETKYRDLFDEATDAIFILELDGRFIDVNRTAYTRLGYTKQELLSLNIRQLDPPEYAKLVSRRLQRVRDRGVAVFDSAHRRKDGSIMPVEVNCRLHEYEGRQVYFSVIRDITERKRAEQLLRESEERYRRFSSLTSDYVYSCSRLGDGPFRVRWIAGAVERITGYSQDEIMARGCWLPFVHRDDRKRVGDNLLSLAPEESLIDEFRLVRKDGSVCWIQEACSCERGSLPEELLLYGTARDITKRKVVEEELREVDTIFSMFLEHSPIYVFFKDEHLRATRVSRNFEALLGRPVNEIVGRSMGELFPGDFGRKIEADDRKVMGDGVAMELEEQFDGRTFKTIKFPISLAGHPPMMAGITIDLTDLKEAQQAVVVLNEHLERLVSERTTALEKTNEELASFCYTVSHELRAPIARIQGFCTVLAEEGDERRRGFIRERLTHASRQLQGVVDAILMLSRLSRVELVPVRVDLSEIVRRKGRALQAEQPERQVELVVHPGIIASADPGLMEICLENLLSNAYKFTTQAESPRIEFGSSRGPDGPVYYVRDNGAGFDMTYSDMLYAPFQRLHQHREFPGSGIGLATVKRAVERHGGRIWAESKVGEGATFYFTLGGIGSWPIQPKA